MTLLLVPERAAEQKTGWHMSITQWQDPDKTLVKFCSGRQVYGDVHVHQAQALLHLQHDPRRTGGGATIAPLPVTPSHYMKQLHEDTTSDKAALEAAIKKGGQIAGKSTICRSPGSDGQSRQTCRRPVVAQERLLQRALHDGAQSLLLGVDPQGISFPTLTRSPTACMQQDRPRCATCG